MKCNIPTARRQITIESNFVNLKNLLFCYSVSHDDKCVKGMDYGFKTHMNKGIKYNCIFQLK